MPLAWPAKRSSKRRHNPRPPSLSQTTWDACKLPWRTASPHSRGLSASLWTEVKRVLDRQSEPAPTDAPGALERGLIALADAALESR